jgi:pSer/pThr/pTyr-binding forkhead associated (FHA) protein
MRHGAMTTTRPHTAWEVEISGQRITLSDRAIVIGRDPQCDVPLGDDRVSWRHLRIEISNNAPLVTDLGSSNGTLVDGARSTPSPK